MTPMTASVALLSLVGVLSAGWLFPEPGPRGEGALAGDTAILLADGTTKDLEDLKTGDLVAGWTAEGKLAPVRVKAVTRANFTKYRTLKTAATSLRGSFNLWVAAVPDRLVPLGKLTTADKVFQPTAKVLLTPAVTESRDYPSNLALYNVELATPGLFVAGGVLVHD